MDFFTPPLGWTTLCQQNFGFARNTGLVTVNNTFQAVLSSVYPNVPPLAMILISWDLQMVQSGPSGAHYMRVIADPNPTAWTLTNQINQGTAALVTAGLNTRFSGSMLMQTGNEPIASKTLTLQALTTGSSATIAVGDCGLAISIFKP